MLGHKLVFNVKTTETFSLLVMFIQVILLHVCLSTKDVSEFKSLSICHLPVDDSSSILVVQHCHMVPSHKMYLHLLLTILQQNIQCIHLLCLLDS